MIASFSVSSSSFSWCHSVSALVLYLLHLPSQLFPDRHWTPLQMGDFHLAVERDIIRQESKWMIFTTNITWEGALLRE